MQFSLTRLQLLVKKQFAENMQLYFFGALALAGIMAVVFLPVLTTQGGFTGNDQAVFFLNGLIVAGGIFTSTLLSKLSDKTKGVQSLMIPASAAEKITNAILFGVVFFPLAFVTIVYPILLLMHFIDTSILGHVNQIFNFRYSTQLTEELFFYLVVQAFVLLLSVTFKRYATIKIIVVIFVSFYGVVLLNSYIAEKFFDGYSTSSTVAKPARKLTVKHIDYDEYQNVIKTTYYSKTAAPLLAVAHPYADLVFETGDNYNRLNVNVWTNHAGFFKALVILAVLFLYITAWYRLKEAQL